MWKKPGNAIPIQPSQVVVGLYVWLDVSWDEHPFLTSRLMVKTAKDVSIIHAFNPVDRLYYYPELSTAEPLPLVAPVSLEAEQAQAEALAKAALLEEMQALERAKLEKRRQQQDAATRANRAWERAAQATREALLNLTRSPRTAGEQLAEISRETASTVARSQEILLHLLGDKTGQGPQFHALNTMTLSMLLGKNLGLTENELADLALAALAHDSGKAKIPPQILLNPQRKKFEEDFYRQHVKLSVQFAKESGAFSGHALLTIADHHEALDGSGWPLGKKDISQGGRILAVVDRYDRLCSPEASGRPSLMPTEALGILFKNETHKLDKMILSLLIKLLGIYPPGTVVMLNDGSLALVIEPGASSMRPKVLLYSPEMAKEDAPILDLGQEPDLKIVEAIRPAALPADVFQWLNPQQRLSYYYTALPVRS